MLALTSTKLHIARFVMVLTIGLFLLQGGIGFWLLQFHQWEHKRHMQGATSSTSFINLSQSQLADLNWEDDHEFEYNGHMYDVVAVSSEANGSKTFHVVCDNFEDELISFLDEIVNQSQSNKQQTTSMLTWAKTAVCEHFPTLLPVVYNAENQALVFAHYLESISTFEATEIERPPLA